MPIQLSRREAFLGMVAAAVAPGARAADVPKFGTPEFEKKFNATFEPLIGVMPDAPLSPLAMNSISARVKNLETAIDFYKTAFGMRVVARQGKKIACVQIGAGPQHIRLVEDSEALFLTTPCFTVTDFEAEKVKRILEGLKIPGVELVYRGPEMGGGGPGAPKGTPEVFFRDPEGLRFQIAHEKYVGGSGINGDVATMEAASGAANAIPIETLNHVSIGTQDVIGNSLFYQKVFRMPIVTTQEKAFNPDFGLGPDLQLGFGIMPLRNDTQKAGVSHFALGFNGFSPERFQDLAKRAGLPLVEPNAPNRAPRTASLRPTNFGGFTIVQGGTVLDADGRMIEILDNKYCAGTGPIGAVCEGRTLKNKN